MIYAYCAIRFLVGLLHIWFIQVLATLVRDRHEILILSVIGAAYYSIRIVLASEKMWNYIQFATVDEELERTQKLLPNVDTGYVRAATRAKAVRDRMFEGVVVCAVFFPAEGLCIYYALNSLYLVGPQ